MRGYERIEWVSCPFPVVLPDVREVGVGDRRRDGRQVSDLSLYVRGRTDGVPKTWPTRATTEPGGGGRGIGVSTEGEDVSNTFTLG